MPRSLLVLMLALSIAPAALAAGPTVNFTLPVENATPATFGDLPWPDDLYFDQGRPGDGDGTLLDSGASIGLATAVIEQNTGSVEQALDLLDGFGTTSAIYFFFSGPIDPATLPPSPRTAPAYTDSVFCADTATGALVPIALKWDLDTRIPNVLGILPVPGKPLAPKTTYACVVTSAVTNAGTEPALASADWLAVRDAASANGDADAIFDPVVTMLGTQSVAAADIAGMTVFTTQSTTADVIKIREDVLPSLAVPTADFTSQPGLVFDTDAKLATLLGSGVANFPHVKAIATGYYGSARFQTHDPDGDGAFGDLPDPGNNFITCAFPCETTDERFTRDGSGTPIVIDTPQIPFTVVIPKGTPPAGGWPVVIQQHGLGGQRDTVVGFGEADAARGFASIGIDAVAHGYRYFDCKPAAACSQDHANNFGGTAVPDGFVDGSLLGFSVSFLTVQLGFFQAFHNFVGIRDNFRQTYVDLMSLVRLLHGHSIDGALGTTLDDANIFYMGHSLGGLMGSGFAPIEPDLKAVLLNATGGGLTNELFLNSSIGSGAQSLVNGILGLDPANVPDAFNFSSNFTQSIIDPADGLNSAALLLDPADGDPRNVIQVEDFGDQVVPNPANEALAVATGLQLFDPFVQNLHQSAYTLPIATTAGTIHGNAAGGATAALLQNGPATHAASIGTSPGTLTFVPEFAHPEEYAVNGGFPNLTRGIRVPNAGILNSVLDWFADVVANGPPGTFTFGGMPNFNPVQNADVPVGASTNTFLARTVSAGGATPLGEPTPDVTVDVVSNDVESRVTVGRSILGSTPLANDNDVPPGGISSVGTLGILPFFVTVQRGLPGIFDLDLTLAYSATELLIAGIAPGSPEEQALVVASFSTGTCTLGGAVCSDDAGCGANGPCLGAGYTALTTTVNTALHTATTPGVTSTGTFAVLHPDVLAGGFLTPRIPGGGNPATDCRGEWEVPNPTNTPFLDTKGLPNQKQTCVDGDPACDADLTANGTCTFRVAICLDQSDAALPTCTAGGTTGYLVKKPAPIAQKDPIDAANGTALVNVVKALGGTVTGPKQNDVQFTSPLPAPICTAFARVKVPLRSSTKVGKRTIVGCPELAGKCKDRDKLKLACVPAS
jgi:hypothetical protein